MGHWGPPATKTAGASSTATTSAIAVNERFRPNNFDIIRLLAALQVAVHHAMTHLRVESDSLLHELSSLFPGVPVFFFISGFLISRSFESNPVMREYALNRAVRIFPALIVCTAVAIVSVALTGYFAGRRIDPLVFVLWVAGQVSFVQVFNPDFMRGFGTGVLNGSLWSITVELQFYVVLPALYVLFGLGDGARARRRLWALAALALLAQLARNQAGDALRTMFWFKLLNASFLPWIFMFLVGVIAQREFARLHRWLAGRFVPLCAVYVAVALFATRGLGLAVGNEINPMLYGLLALVVFSAAYTQPALARRLLRGNDISYGVYIYHIPVVNLLLHGGRLGQPGWVACALAASVVLAALSWWCVEKPSLRLKRHPLNPLRPPAP